MIYEGWFFFISPIAPEESLMPIFFLIICGLSIGISSQAMVNDHTPGSAGAFLRYAILFLLLMPFMILSQKNPRLTRKRFGHYYYLMAALCLIVLMALTGSLLHLMILIQIRIPWHDIGWKAAAAALVCYLIYPHVRKLTIKKGNNPR